LTCWIWRICRQSRSRTRCGRTRYVIERRNVGKRDLHPTCRGQNAPLPLNGKRTATQVYGSSIRSRVGSFHGRARDSACVQGAFLKNQLAILVTTTVERAIPNLERRIPTIQPRRSKSNLGPRQSFTKHYVQHVRHVLLPSSNRELPPRTTTWFRSIGCVQEIAAFRKLTLLGLQDLRSVLHTYILGKSLRSKSSLPTFRIPPTRMSAKSIQCCREALAYLPCGHLEYGAAWII
jgi:hypothetical protein